MKWKERVPQLADELSRLCGLSPDELLKVPPDATVETIKAAYRRMARAYHPDKADPFMRKHNEQVMKLVNDAYARLITKIENSK